MKIAPFKKYNLRETASFDSGLFKSKFRKGGIGGEVELFHFLFGCQMAKI